MNGLTLPDGFVFAAQTKLSATPLAGLDRSGIRIIESGLRILQDRHIGPLSEGLASSVQAEMDSLSTNAACQQEKTENPTQTLLERVPGWFETVLTHCSNRESSGTQPILNVALVRPHAAHPAL
jgi:hypothetical protein